MSHFQSNHFHSAHFESKHWLTRLAEIAQELGAGFKEFARRIREDDERIIQLVAEYFTSRS